MSLEFNDLLGKPFHPNVRKELEKRRTLTQTYEDSPTLKNPYFKLQRLQKLSNRKNFDVDEKPTNLKFWEITKFSKLGLKDIEDKMRDGGNLKAPLGITSVNIELLDYTFHKVTIEFVVPDVGDWKEFKDTWLIFGAPVQYEFGKKSLVDIEDGEDIRPDKEIREGIIANFSWGMGDDLRTITGSMTIYSSLMIELTSKAYPDNKVNDKFFSYFNHRLKELYVAPPNITIDDIKKFYGDDGEINPDLSSINLDNEIENRFFNRTKNFYSIISKETYNEKIKNIGTLSQRFRKQAESIPRVGSGTATNLVRNLGLLFFDEKLPQRDTETLQNITDIKKLERNFLPFGFDIINEDGIELLTDEKIADNKLEKPERPELQNGGEALSTEEIYYIENNRGFKLADGDMATTFDNWVYDNTKNLDIPEPSHEQAGRLVWINYGERYLQWYKKNYGTKRVLDSKFNFLSSTSLQKYILSKLHLENDDDSIFNNGIYFYVSMRFIQDTINEYNAQKYGENKKDLIANYIFEDTRIRDLSFLGFGSSQPDRVLINPWKKKYSKNVDKKVDVNKMPDDTLVNGKDFPKNRFYKYDTSSSAQYTLLEDVFISAPLLRSIAEDSNSIMSLVEKVINEIENSTDGLIQLQRIGNTSVSVSRYHSTYIGYYDVSTIGDISKDEDYHTFNLFDPREKIRDIQVDSSLDDSFSEYAYYQSLGRIPDDKTLFLHENIYYNKDGSINTHYTAINNNKKTAKKNTEIINSPISRDVIRAMAEDNKISVTYTDFIDDNDLWQEYEAKAKELMESSQSFVEGMKGMYFNEVKKVGDRIEKYQKGGDIDAIQQNINISLLAFTKAYFSAIVKIYHNVYNNSMKSSNTTTIPLKIDITLDGISGIVNGNAFQVDLESFPMAYNNLNLSPLFVVSTLSHSIDSSNDWETTVGGFLFIPSAIRDNTISSSEKMKSIIDSNNLILTVIKEALEEKINEVLSAD